MNIFDCYIEEIDLHIKRIEAVLPDIESWMPLTSLTFENIEKIKSIDSFIYRFSKVQDKIGDKLFPEMLKKLQEYRENMSLRDVLYKLEKLEIIQSADEWIYFRELRNIATHEYPGNEEEVVEAVINIIEAYKKIRKVYDNLKTLP